MNSNNNNSTGNFAARPPEKRPVWHSSSNPTITARIQSYSKARTMARIAAQNPKRPATVTSTVTSTTVTSTASNGPVPNNMPTSSTSNGAKKPKRQNYAKMLKEEDRY